ncbi:MAG: phospholipase D family protein [Gemmataceae bacterium]|nr:phospholipase D family protein [Gemmataceae bacterium]
MMWLLLATGFTGGLTLVFLVRGVYHRFVKPLAVLVHFSPKGGCTDAVVRELASARHEILVQAYSFTSKPIAEALVEAKGRGVHVDILLDHSNEHETHTELGDLLSQGMVPLIDKHHAIAHNKIMLIDGHTLVTGSFNFTNQAEHQNAENLLILKHHRELVRSYRQNFLEHKGHCEPATIIKGGQGSGGGQRKVA